MDATEFGRELAAQVKAAVRAATAELRAEHAREVETLNAQIAALSAAVEAIPEVPELPEIPAAPTVEEFSEALATIQQAQEHDTERLSTALSDAAASLAEQVETLSTRLTEVESRAPEKGEKGDPGAAGIAPSAEDVALAYGAQIKAEVAAWALDFERRAQGSLERAVDRLPKPRDGKDGIDFETWDVELHDDGRTVTFTLGRGDDRLSKSFRLPTTIYHGTYSHGREYEAHDCVTWGGSMWVATVDNPDGTPGNSKGWQLAVKKGQPGRDRDKPAAPDPRAPVKIGGAK